MLTDHFIMADNSPLRVQSCPVVGDDPELTPFKFVAGTPSGEVEFRVPRSKSETAVKTPINHNLVGREDNFLREQYADLKSQFDRLSEEFRVALDGSDSVDMVLRQSRSRQVQGRSNCDQVSLDNMGPRRYCGTDSRGSNLGQGYADVAVGSSEGFQYPGSVSEPVYSDGIPIRLQLARKRVGHENSNDGGIDFLRPDSSPHEGLRTEVSETQTQTVGVPATKYKKPPEYNGTTSWQDYLVQFEMLAKVNKWGYKEKAMELATSLRGVAVAVLSDLGVVEREDFNSLTAALTARFEPKNQSEIYRAQIKSRIRKKGESLPELAQDVKRLVRFAYPTAGVELREQLARDCFIDSLGDDNMQYSVYQKGTTTVDQAVSAALQYEAFYASRRKPNLPRPVRVQYEMGGPYQPDIFADSTTRMEQTVNKLAQIVESVKMQKGKVKCFYCGEEGHIRKHCNKKLRGEQGTRQSEARFNARKDRQSGNQTRLG